MATAFVDTHAHPAALPWYSSGRTEPAGTAHALALTRAVGIGNISLDSLLDSILVNARQGDDLIVVGHGREGGLSMRLVAGAPSRARAELITQLAADRPTPDPLLGSMPAIPAAHAASVCQITEAQVGQLRAKMNRVRALTLTHVAFRACKMGMWPNVLRAYKPFFGCKLVSAPDLRDTYGTIRPGTPTANMNQWIAGHSHPHRVFVYNSAPNRVAIATTGGQDDDHTYSLDFAYESAQALGSWTTRYLGGPSAASFPYHGQWLTYPGPGEPQILFVGDPRYNAHIVVA